MADDRWTQLALNPAENLETELKGWLDPSSNEDKANLAQAILAMANHGGGVILIGFDEEESGWAESQDQAPATSFTTDAVNGIVEKFADPSFHCELHTVTHDDLAHSHPLIIVPGGHRVPVKAKRGGPDGKHVQQDVYYIRRPGPQSAPPRNAAEWQQLIHRCVMADRDALLDNLRAAMSGERSRAPSEVLQERAAQWRSTCFGRLSELTENEGTVTPYVHGFWWFAYVFDEIADVNPKRLVQEMRAVERQIGWPAWIMFDNPPLKPYPFDGLVECFVRDDTAGPAHSDFWRAAPDGRFFLLRGYQEDDPENAKSVQPGQVFDRAIPIWRVGECLLHAARMAERLGVPQTAVAISAEWTGLKGRTISEVFDGWGRPGYSAATQNAVEAPTVVVDADRIRLQLVDLVIQLTKPLYEVFDFEVIDRGRVEQELRKMLQRTGETL